MDKREFSNYIVYLYFGEVGGYRISTSIFYNKDKMLEYVKEKSESKQIYNIEVEEVYRVDWRIL